MDGQDPDINYTDTDTDIKSALEPSMPFLFLTSHISEFEIAIVCAAINKQFKVLFIGLGTKEPNPFPSSVGAFRNMLDNQGIKYIFYQ